MKRFVLLALSISLAATVAVPGSAFSENMFGGSAVRGIDIRNDVLWGATDSGVLRYDISTGEQRLFTVEDGLLEEHIATVAVSRTGEVWAGSAKGVTCLEGGAWTKVVLPGNQSLDETLRIAFAPEGNIWICTRVIQYQYNGLIWLSWSLENVYRYSSFYDLDMHPDGRMWFGTLMGLLSYHDYGWDVYNSDPAGPGRTGINAVAVDVDGGVWCGTNRGLYRYYNGVWEDFGIEGLYGSKVLDLAVDDAGTVWASATGDEGAGLSRFDGDSWERTVPASQTGGSAPLCIRFGDNGDMWLGALGGLFRFDIESVHVGARVKTPKTTVILGNYPNPFNPDTVIEYEISKARNARISIYNSSGQKIRSLMNGAVSPGRHTISWDGRDDNGRMVATGMYLASLTAGNHRVSHRMTLIR